ncbi:hypothetical protein N7510_009167 [Penicillium lagena]|uniref:uncharacterized protein n=1 Tax=Penicillium lagena TaxID=94218 RepID=UPI00253F9494|nr:uncharacterized protein N7510_009167 [Penicillium lagena]KAJ5606386.1 hypothetical protein N7510_009167 [Penicillium lagena]
MPAATGILVTVTATAEASRENKPTCSDSNILAVGAGVGVSLGALLVASIAILVWREKSRSKLQTDPANPVSYPTNHTTNGKFKNLNSPVEMDYSTAYEIDGNARNEIYGNARKS